MIHTLVPLCVTLGITADTAGPNEVVLSLDWAPNLCTGNDVLHGGIVMALADSSGAVCAFLNLPQGAGGTATIESKTNFFAATRSGTVKAHSRPLHVGKRVIVVETEERGPAGGPPVKFPPPVGIVQRGGRGGGAVPVVAVSPQDRDAVVADRIKS